MCQPGFGRKRRPTVRDWPEDGGGGTGMSSTVSWGVRLQVRLMRVLWVFGRFQASYDAQEPLLAPIDWGVRAGFREIPEAFAPS